MNGGSRLQCHIPALPLQAGRYYANVGLFPLDYEFMYDYHWQMHSFQVLGQTTNLSGIVSVDPVWKLPS
jgi:lipopolysaccharide transport system ATP-binding protein